MRTTLNLDEDVLRAVKEIARIRRSTAGRVLSDLVRGALAAQQQFFETRNGVPVLPPREGEGIVTPDIVDRLRDEP